MFRFFFHFIYEIWLRNQFTQCRNVFSPFVQFTGEKCPFCNQTIKQGTCGPCNDLRSTIGTFENEKTNILEIRGTGCIKKGEGKYKCAGEDRAKCMACKLMEMQRSCKLHIVYCNKQLILMQRID